MSSVDHIQYRLSYISLSNFHGLFNRVQLEEPFNILPLRQYSDNVNDSVNFVASAYRVVDEV